MKTSTSNEDIVIAALSFAKKRSLEGNPFSHSDLIDHLTKMGFKTNGEHANFISELNNEMHPKSWNSTKVNSFISLDAYLGLLDYEELQQARQDAKDAKKTANIAIWLNIISTILAAIIGILQLVSCTPTKKQEKEIDIDSSSVIQSSNNDDNYSNKIQSRETMLFDDKELTFVQDLFDSTNQLRGKLYIQLLTDSSFSRLFVLDGNELKYFIGDNIYTNKIDTLKYGNPNSDALYFSSRTRNSFTVYFPGSDPQTIQFIDSKKRFDNAYWDAP